MSDNQIFVRFIADYADGSRVDLFIDDKSLEFGDHVVPAIVQARQDVRQLPRGVVTNVRRAS